MKEVSQVNNLQQTIRSQDGQILIMVDRIVYFQHSPNYRIDAHTITGNVILLGRYGNEKRATQVINNLSSWVGSRNIVGQSLCFYMPQDDERLDNICEEIE